MKNQIKSFIRNHPGLKSRLKPLISVVAGKSRNTEYDILTAELIRRNLSKASNCVDVGCHAGEVMDFFLQYAPEGKHFGFEPLPRFFEYSSRHFQRNENVTLYPYALAAENGETRFVQNIDNPGYSGLRKRRMSGASDRVSEFDVSIRRMDDVVGSDIPIAMIKIDVEGAELGVMQGAIEILRKYRPHIIFEHGKGAAEFYETRPEQIFDFLDELGYDIFPVSRNSVAISGRDAFSVCFDTGSDYYFIAVAKGDNPWK